MCCAADDFVPTRPIGVVNFADEEGARFGVACAGSRIITGQLDADRARGLTDAAGVSMAEAMLASGRNPADLGRDAQTLGRVGAFVELHVEQGRALIDTGDPLAIGTGLWPHGRWRIDFPGEANHAGTTRLADRRDAMIGYAHTVLAARSAAEHRGCLATIGKVTVRPGGVNAIASSVTGWLDARGADEAAVQAAVRDITAVAAEHGATVRQESWTPPTSFDPGLARQTAADSRCGRAAAGHRGRPRRRNPGRRGHSDRDALRAEPDRDLALHRPNTPNATTAWPECGRWPGVTQELAG